MNIHAQLLKFQYFCLFFCSFLFSNQDLAAQNKNFDTLKIKANRYLIIKDSILPITEDTVIILSHHIKYKIRRNPTPFIERQGVKPFWEMIYHHEGAEDTTFTAKSEAMYQKHEGKTIRKIMIRRMGPFSNSIYDTTRRFQNNFEYWADELHLDTKEWVIRNYLLFQPKDTVNIYQIADNERVLRQLPFLLDARIYIQAIPHNSSEVNILVLTKDIWSIGGDGSIDDLKGGRIRIFENNFLGSGHQFSITSLYNNARTPPFGFDNQYIANNLFRSFINAEFRYTSLNTGNDYGLAYGGAYMLRLNRPFLVPTMRWAGGLEISKNWSINVSNLNDSLFSRYAYDLKDVWLGYNSDFLGKKIKKGEFVSERIRTEVGLRIIQQRFLERPEVRIDTNQNYQNSTLFLANIALFSRNYYKTRYLLGFGRTEDIPYGYVINLNVGWEKREFYNRWFTSLELSRQYLSKNNHYWDYTLRIGSYFRNSQIEQGQLDVQSVFYSRLFIRKKLKFRHFAKVRYTWGINRFGYESINLNNDNGIRGFSTSQMMGNQRITINSEGILFLPKALLGFHFALLSFVDVAWLGSRTSPTIFLPSNKPIIAPQSWVLGTGLGLRFRNENFIFKTVELRLTYYPANPTDVNLFNISIATNLALKIRDFVGKPSLLTYQ